MKAYSEDLRRKIVDAIERVMPEAQAARTFGDQGGLTGGTGRSAFGGQFRRSSRYFEQAGYRPQVQPL